MKSFLSTLSKRFSDRTVESILSEIEAISTERREFFRAHDGRIREQRHELVARAITEAEYRTDALMREAQDSGHLNPATLAAEAAAWTAVRDPILVAALHTAVDSATDLSPLSKAQYEGKIAEYDSEIHARKIELERRDAAELLESAQQGLAAVGERAQ